MINIWVQWNNGVKEIVDEANSESEALYLIKEYRLAFNSSIRKVGMFEDKPNEWKRKNRLLG